MPASSSSSLSSSSSSSPEPATDGEQCDECGTLLYRVGEVVSAGTYIRVDDESFHRVVLAEAGHLPPSFDGHIAVYRLAMAPCICERRHMRADDASPNDASPAGAVEARKSEWKADPHAK